MGLDAILQAGIKRGVSSGVPIEGQEGRAHAVR